MTPLRQGLADYLTMRRALGFKLEHDGKTLATFVTSLEAQGIDTITIDNALAWVTSPPVGAGQATLANRMTMIRGFAAYMHTVAPATQVPPPGLLSQGQHRAVPYLYSDDDIIALIAAAGRLPTRLGALTMQTMIGFLSVTGLRIAEALAVNRDDVDVEQALLTVNDGKLGKPRLIPLHPTTIDALIAYLRRRDALCPRPATTALFISAVGTRKRYSCLRTTFTHLLRSAQVQPRAGRCRPRLHDMRHTLAVRTLIDWYRDGDDVQARLPLLSTFLGHSEPAYTYWYLHAAPELLTEAAHRLDANHDLEGRP